MLVHYLSTHTNTNMKKLSVITLLFLLAITQLSHSRSITYGSDMIMASDSVSGSGDPVPLLDLGSSETCEPVYGFLPCSTNAWGLLFLIVVYEILLSTGASYVATGSDLFFQITGPGVFGASLFQILGVIPQIILVLVSALSGSSEAAQQRATLGMGLVAGTTVMLLTLIWGISVILGSYDLSEVSTSDETGSKKNAGKGVVTDAETSYTARLMLVSLLPFLILLLAKVFDSSSGRRVIILVSLLVTVILFLGYVLYQIFQPWVQNRRFEYLMNKYAKDKLLMLLSRNGKPDSKKIQRLFSRIDKDKSTSVSPLELRVLLLGVQMDDEDLSTERDVENILGSFDVSGDGRISQEEFIRGMTSLATDLADQTPDRIKIGGGNNSQKQLQQRLLSKTTNTNTNTSQKASSNSWLNYAKAFSFVTLGTAMTIALSQPLVTSVNGFAQATNLSSFCVSYVAIPFALNYGVAVQSIASARQKTQKSISLALSSLYGGVYMNNIMGMISFLATIFARHLWADVFAEVAVVLVICIVMTMLASLGKKFSSLTGYLVLLLYPISLALVYLITSVLGWA